MKRIISLMLAAACCAALLAGCEGGEEKSAAPVSMELAGMRTQFEYGERFTSMGMQVTLTLDDGTTRAGALGEYSCDSSAYRADAAGTYPITVTLNGYEIQKTYDVTVAAQSTGGEGEQSAAALSIDDISAWVDYAQPFDFVPVFRGAEPSAIEYTFDAEAIELDADKCTVKAKKAGVTKVTATAGELQTTFTVTCYPAVDMKNGEDYTSPRWALDRKQRAFTSWQTDGSATTTAFIGDSFFDTNFWTNFDTAYQGFDALCLGVGSSTTYDWEKFISAENFFKGTAPKNIAMHLGTNNIYSFSKGVDETAMGLVRLFSLIHGMFPETNIYFFGISYRATNEAKIRYTRMVNEIIAPWCAARSYMTYIDTPPLLTADMLKDGTHPKLEYYSVFTTALAATDIVMLQKADAGVQE